MILFMVYLLSFQFIITCRKLFLWKRNKLWEMVYISMNCISFHRTAKTFHYDNLCHPKNKLHWWKTSRQPTNHIQPIYLKTSHSPLMLIYHRWIFKGKLSSKQVSSVILLHNNEGKDIVAYQEQKQERSRAKQEPSKAYQTHMLSH